MPSYARHDDGRAPPPGVALHPGAGDTTTTTGPTIVTSIAVTTTVVTIAGPTTTIVATAIDPIETTVGLTETIAERGRRP